MPLDNTKYLLSLDTDDGRSFPNLLRASEKLAVKENPKIKCFLCRIDAMEY